MQNFDKIEDYKLLTKEEVAKILLVQPETLKTYRKNGSLQSVKIGREYRYLEKSVIKFIEKKLNS